MEKRKWSQEETIQFSQEHPEKRLFYFNPEDTNLFVKVQRFAAGAIPKHGYTMNFANPLAYIVLRVIIAVIVAFVLF